MKIHIFIKNTVILVATSLILRTVGIFFRVWLADSIGSEGLGLYQMIFSVYILAATFAASGISTAVTRLVAENESKGLSAIRKIIRVATLITLFAAAISTATVFFFAEPISRYLLKDMRAVLSLKILSLSLPFMGLSSCMRGYFIARRKTLQPSLVQLFEQTVRIAVVVTLITLTADKGLTYSAAAVLLGDTVAEAASFFVNFILYKRDSSKLSDGEKIFKVAHKIYRIALPLSGSAYLSSALHTAENLLVPLRLGLYYNNKSRGLQLFGAVRGMALPVLFFPASFLTSLSTMLIPEVSSAASDGNCTKIKETVETAISTTLILSTFTACVFMFNAADLGQLIYSDRDVGQIILILSPIIPFMYLESVNQGLLKGLDCQKSLLKFNTYDSLLRIALVYITLPRFGIKAYFLIMIISNTFTSVQGLVCLVRRTGLHLQPLKWILLPLVVSTLGGTCGRLASVGLHNTVLRLAVSLLFQFVFGITAFYLNRKSDSKLPLKVVR